LGGKEYITEGVGFKVIQAEVSGGGKRQFTEVFLKGRERKKMRVHRPEGKIRREKRNFGERRRALTKTKGGRPRMRREGDPLKYCLRNTGLFISRGTCASLARDVQGKRKTGNETAQTGE